MPKQSLKLFLIAAIFLLLPSFVWAAPDITSAVPVTAFSHGAVVNVSGSGFGSKFPVAPLQYDPVDGMYSGLSNGDSIPFGGSNPWKGEVGNPEFAGVYKTINPRGYNHAHYSNSAGMIGPVIGQGKVDVGGNNYPSAAGQKLYISWWLYPAGDMTVGGTNASNKFFRLTPTATWSGASIAWEPTILNLYVFPPSGYSTISMWPSWSDYGHIGEWNRNETIVDNTFNPKPRIKTFINNVQQVDVYSGKTGFCGSTPSNCTVASAPDITGIYTLGFDASNSTDKEPVVDMGEIYVDNTLARVEICDQETKAASNHCEIQIPQTTWDDGQLQIKVNQGSFADNSSQYLYVMDAAGNTNVTGYPITFGSSIATFYSTSDFLSLISNWLKTGTVSDLNLDGVVNAKDLGMMMSKWN